MFTKQEDPQPSLQRAPMKFTYTSGERPLEGYIIKRGIGTGGFGEVYFAISDAGKEVALKRVQRNLDVELRGVRQCLNLQHPHLLALFDIRYDDVGQAWIVMEYMSGESLQQVIERNPNGMPLDQTRHWLRGITSGLAALHDQGIVHRDLKPGNLFNDRGFVKIGDYGLSKFISCSRRSGQTESVGTFHYMAPEIGRGRYGKEIDVYALGILVYEMLTGRVPFDGESSQEIIMKHLTSEPDLASLPPKYRAVVAECLHKDPQQRPTSVEDVARRLDVFVARHDGILVMEAAVLSDEDERAATDASKQAAPSADAIVEEPIWASARDGWNQIVTRWRAANIPGPVRVLLLACAAVLLVSEAALLVPFGLLLAIAYAGYYVVWTLFRADGSPFPRGKARENPAAARDAVAVSQPTAVRPVVARRPKRRPTWQAVAQRELLRRSWVQRAREFNGSLIMSLFVTGVVSVLAMLPDTGPDSQVSSWGPLYAWMALTSLAGSWSLLWVAKRWEGHADDPALQRFEQLVMGLAVGAVSYGLAQWLMVQPNYLLPLPRGILRRLPESLYAVDGGPTFLAYLGYFAATFMLIRWWKFADPMRRVRFSLAGTAFAFIVAMFVHMFLPFPRGAMLAVAMAVAVQMAAPWIKPDRRDQLQQLALREAAAPQVRG